jgi:hypothetical protein
MSSFVINGGKVNEEGHGKPWYHLFRQGYANGWATTQRAAGANMSVDVSVGAGSIATAAGVDYYSWTDAVTNVTITTADPSNPRRDIVVAYVQLSSITSATTNNSNALLFKAVPGTPNSSPSDPLDATIQSSVGAGNPWIKIARVAVGANAANIINTVLTDLGTPMALQMPYLFGGSNNSVGHLVPNVTDDTVMLLNAAQTATNKTLSTPKLLNGLNDASNNEMLRVAPTASAVNDITLANAAAGGSPTISASGDDTNVSVYAKGKGAGFFLPQLPVYIVGLAAISSSAEVVQATLNIPAFPVAVKVTLMGWASAALGLGAPTQSWMNFIRRGNSTAGTQLAGIDNTKSAAAGTQEARATSLMFVDNVAANTAQTYVWTTASTVSIATGGYFLAIVTAQ